MKIQFIKSPIAEFLISEKAGNINDYPDGVAQSLIDAGYAVSVEPQTETMISKVEIETPEKKKSKK
jgi:hypothetical protein